MNELIIDRIKKEFPDVVWDGSASAWGIECGTGWGLVVYAFVADATALCREEGSRLVIRQMKNKFGKLRLYCHPCDEDATDEAENSQRNSLDLPVSLRQHPATSRLKTLLNQYEKASALICEVCGAPGQIEHRQGGFAQSLCTVHYALTLRTSPLKTPDKYAFIDDDAAKEILSRVDGLVALPPVADLFSHLFEAYL